MENMLIFPTCYIYIVYNKKCKNVPLVKQKNIQTKNYKDTKITWYISTVATPNFNITFIHIDGMKWPHGKAQK